MKNKPDYMITCPKCKRDVCIMLDYNDTLGKDFYVFECCGITVRASSIKGVKNNYYFKQNKEEM